MAAVPANRQATSLPLEPPLFRTSVCGFDLALVTNQPAEIDASQLWNDLKSGASKVVDSFSTDDHHYMIMGDSPPSLLEQTAYRAADLEALEAWLRGSPQKCIGIECDLGPSTISMRLRTGLKVLGLSCHPSRAPLLLVVLARVPKQLHPGSLRVREYLTDGRRFLIVQMTRPDALVKDTLSVGERQVVRALVDGQTYQEIADQRRTSSRTVANQVAAAFRKLRVSGRPQLLGFLAELALAPH